LTGDFARITTGAARTSTADPLLKAVARLGRRVFARKGWRLSAGMGGKFGPEYSIIQS
jgi:hypothetical protein